VIKVHSNNIYYVIFIAAPLVTVAHCHQQEFLYNLGHCSVGSLAGPLVSTVAENQRKRVG